MSRHDPKRCRMCARLRHPSGAVTPQDVIAALARQTRTNGENGSGR